MNAEWLTAVGTIVLAAGTVVLAIVAIFQDAIRGLIYHPRLNATVRTRPPDCVKTYASKQDGTPIADVFYMRIWVENNGNAPAKNVEVYAKELLRKRADGGWDQVAEFPPMNLKWANAGGTIYFPIIVPGMGKHCDVGHITDPGFRSDPSIREENPRLNLASNQTSLSFDLMTLPNTKGHIVGPGDYKLKILLAAENARRAERTISLSLTGNWNPDETRMLQNEVGVSID